MLSDQGRKYVYVINDKDEVVYRTVELGQEISGLRVIKKGVSRSDRIVMSGMQRVSPGKKVHAVMHEPPALPPANNGLGSPPEAAAPSPVKDKQEAKQPASGPEKSGT